MKETLTKSKAVEDLKNYSIEIIIRSFATVTFVAFAVSLLVYWFKDLPIYYFFCLSPIIAFAISAFVSLIKYAFILYKVYKNKFYITSSTLVTSYKKQGWRSTGLTGTLLFRKPYSLQFETYGQYFIPEGKNYKWSKIHCMDDVSVYNYAVSGDEYYLVIMNNQILYAYNKKLFELEK